MNTRLAMACGLCAVFIQTASADIEEVTFQAAAEPSDQFPNPGGPQPVGLAGTFFFDSTQFTGGLRSVFERPDSPSGAPGTAEVFFQGLPGGSLTTTYANGAVVTIPFSSGFSLHGDFAGPVCAEFDDCFYSVGKVLTLSQFNAAQDPWALIFNGMEGSFGNLLGLVGVPAVPPGQGEWLISGGGSFEVHSVPEPGLLLLLATGLSALGIVRLRRRRALH